MRANNIKTLAWAGFVFVLIGAMLPWAHIPQGTQRTEIQRANVAGFQEVPIGGYSIQGFRTSASAVGLSLPGWCVVLAAVVCAILISTSPGASAFAWTLCIYGLLHIGFMTMALTNTPNMDPAYGLFIVFMGLAMQIASLIGRRGDHHPDPTNQRRANRKQPRGA